MCAHINPDPYYETNNLAIKRATEKKSKDNLEKSTAMITEHFNTEIKNRQGQIDAIEQQLVHTQKLLHLIRYVLITSYYDSKSLEYNGDEDINYTTSTYDNQNRIHPAIKKLLGKNADVKQILISNTKRKIHPKVTVERQQSKSTASPSSHNSDDEDEQVCKKRRIDVNEPKMEMNRGKKAKHRIIVGNVSKFISKSEQVDSNLTHKWMVYVRGPKETPDIGHFVEECKFYLHPSYKPHDVVNVNEPPFHLTRLGWGEFPIRVRIYFKNALNKPVDVVHNLKLDKTYTGRQTLGNETIVEVFLHNTYGDEEENGPIESECHVAKPIKVEHDYFYEEIAPQMEIIATEHNYSTWFGNIDEIKQETHLEDNNSPLIHGLDASYCTERDSRQSSYLFVPNCNKAMLPNGNVVNIKVQRPSESSNEPKFVIKLPRNDLKSVGEVLSYLFKRLPLYKSRTDANCAYPFMAASFQVYKSWPLPIRLSYEWTRAKAVQRMLQENNVSNIETWSTKAILMYGRSHFYTPATTYGVFRNAAMEKRLLLSCYEQKSGFPKRVFSLKSTECFETNVDVESDDAVQNERLHNVSIMKNFEESEDFSPLYNYIRHTALDCGIVLKSEILEKSVRFRGAERMILEAVKCFIDNLIRRAANHLVCATNIDAAFREISVDDVNIALNERQEMSSIQKFQQKKRHMDYFL